MGSAANAIIDRLPRKESWFKGRSHCDKCGHELKTLDLIPVISYLWLRGKCRYCHSPIPVRNLVVEVLMASGFVLSYLSHLGFLSYLMIWLTTIIAVMDWETMLVSEWLVGAWLVAVLLSMNYELITTNLLGLAVGVGVIGGLWAVTRGRGMGFGDVEIAGVMGLWLGWPKIFWGLEVAFITGAAVGLTQILLHKNKLKGKIAFGTFLILGAWVVQLLRV